MIGLFTCEVSIVKSGYLIHKNVQKLKFWRKKSQIFLFKRRRARWVIFLVHLLQVYLNMLDVYYVVTPMYTAEAEIQLVELGLCLISQVMDRFHKKAYAYGRKHLYTYFLILANHDRVFMIKYHDKFVYCHIHFIGNYMFKFQFKFMYKLSVKTNNHMQRSMLCTGCIHHVQCTGCILSGLD